MRLPTVTAIAAMLTLTSPGLTRAADTPQAAVPARIVATQVALRDLWLGHIFWVRNVVGARLANNAAAAKTAEEQVVDNAKAIAGAIEPYCGKPASEKLFGLLAGHWGAIRAYLDATQAGDKSAQDAACAGCSPHPRQVPLIPRSPCAACAAQRATVVERAPAGGR